MTKEEQKRLEKWAKTATAEGLLDRYWNAIDSAARMSAAWVIAWGATARVADSELRNAKARADLYRAELLRRLGGAS